MPAEVLDIACKFMLGVWRGGVSNKRVLQQLLALQVETDLTTRSLKNTNDNGNWGLFAAAMSKFTTTEGNMCVRVYRGGREGLEESDANMLELDYETVLAILQRCQERTAVSLIPPHIASPGTLLTGYNSRPTEGGRHIKIGVQMLVESASEHSVQLTFARQLTQVNHFTFVMYLMLLLHNLAVCLCPLWSSSLSLPLPLTQFLGWECRLWKGHVASRPRRKSSSTLQHGLSLCALA
eukprot:jgi/Mesen1/2520/ME000160S01637